MNSTKIRGPAGLLPARWVCAVAVLAITTMLAGCDSLLDVDPNTKTVPADELQNPTSLNARLIGAQADFFFAADMAIVYGGLFTDELIDATGFEAVDQRRVTADNGAIGSTDEAPEGIDGLWTPMQRAAAVTDQLQEDILAGNYPEQIPNAEESPELARVSLLAGYSKTILADLFCSTAFGGTGPEYTSDETYELAIEEFTLAITADNASEEVRNAALVGRARARLQLGDEVGALADARLVPTDFEFIADVYSNNSQKEENDLWNMLFDSQRFSVGPDFRDATVGNTATPDPRVVVELDPTDGVGTDGFTPLYQPEKYSSSTSPVRFASGDEAGYIIAELVGGQEAVDIINDVRARNGISEEFASSDEGEILRMVLEERSHGLFLEGQRLADLQRYRERHGIDLFPTGTNFGDQTCMPLPNAERDNNPDI